MNRPFRPWMLVLAALAGGAASALERPALAQPATQPVSSRDFGRALVEMKARRWEPARALLDPFVRAWPDDLAARNNLAVCLIRLRRFEEAETHLQQVLGKAPQRAGSHLNIGVARQGKDDTKQGLASTEVAVSLSTRQNAAAELRAAALFNKGWLLDELSAEEEAREANAAPPPGARARRSVALLAQAVQAYEESLRVRPKYAKAWLGLAIAQARLGRFAEARKSLHEADLSPGDDADLPPLIQANRFTLDKLEKEKALAGKVENKPPPATPEPAKPAPAAPPVAPPKPAVPAPPQRTILADGLIGATGLWDWSKPGSILLYLAVQLAALSVARRGRAGATDWPEYTLRSPFPAATLLGLALPAASWGLFGWLKWLSFAALTAGSAAALRAAGDKAERSRREPAGVLPNVPAPDPRASASGSFIGWHCPHCGKKLRAVRRLAGRTTKCPDCQRVQRIPPAGTGA